MNLIITFLSIITGIIILLLIIAIFIRKEYSTHREIIIRIPAHNVFDYIKHIKNQNNYNKWIMVDPEMRKEFKGTDGTKGFIFGWNGNKEAGQGEQEIKSVEEGKYIETEIRFVRPFAGVAHAKMITETMEDNHTKLSWSTNSQIKYPLNIMVSFIVKMLEKDMDISLNNLKIILEK